MQVNRSLKNKHFDHIDHALGRPVNPQEETYRNYFCICKDDPRSSRMLNSRHWRCTGSRGEYTFFSVTKIGRNDLSNHLKEIGDKNKVFYVSVFDGEPSTVIAESRSKAKYSHFLDIRDCFPDVTFGDYCKTVKVSSLPTYREVM